MLLANDDEARRNRMPSSCPQLEGLLVVAVKGFKRRLQCGGQLERIEIPALPRPFFGIFVRMCSQRLRNIGISSPGMLSATGTRGSLTMPHSMASISEKSLIVQGTACLRRSRNRAGRTAWRKGR